MVDANEILKAINNFGVVGFLVCVLVGGLKEWWVFGWQYREMRREMEQWRELALNGTSLAVKSVHLAARSRSLRRDDEDDE